MFMPRHPKSLLSTRAVAMQVVEQKQGTQAMDKHVLLVDVPKPVPGVSIMPPVPVKQD